MTRQRQAELAMLATPFVLVLVLHVTTQIQPRSVAAQPRTFDIPTEPALPQPAPNHELDNWITSITFGLDMRSPMNHGLAPEVQRTIPVIITPTPEPLYDNPLKNAMLTSVIGTDDQGLVVINGRLYRMNDEPSPGCRIISIDAKRQIVGVLLPTGETHFIQAKRP